MGRRSKPRAERSGAKAASDNDLWRHSEVGVGDSFIGTGFDLGLEATGFTPAMGYHFIPVPGPKPGPLAFCSC